MEEKRLRIGELLIEAGVLNDEKLREALELQKKAPRPLGQILVDSGFVTEAQLIQSLSRQLSIPWVSLWHVDVAPELLHIVSREEAEKFRMLPIYARTVRGERPALFVAMDDPTNQEALEFVRETAGMEVRPMIAAPTDLRQAIRALYSGEEEEEEEPAPVAPPLSPRRSQPPPPPPPRAAVTARSGHEDALLLTEPAEDEDEGDDGGEERKASTPSTSDLDAGLEAVATPPSEEAIEEPPAPEPAPSFLVPGAIESGAPARPASGRAATLDDADEPDAHRAQRLRRALAFTFLDGTSIAIGMPSAPEAEPTLRLSELIKALRRFADDPNVPEPYGPRGLSLVVAAILEILSKKELITEAELAETIGRRPPGR